MQAWFEVDGTSLARSSLLSSPRSTFLPFSLSFFLLRVHLSASPPPPVMSAITPRKPRSPPHQPTTAAPVRLGKHARSSRWSLKRLLAYGLVVAVLSAIGGVLESVKVRNVGLLSMGTRRGASNDVGREGGAEVRQRRGGGRTVYYRGRASRQKQGQEGASTGGKGRETGGEAPSRLLSMRFLAALHPPHPSETSASGRGNIVRPGPPC